MQLKSLLKTNALIIIALLAVSFSGFAQAPNLLNYQGVARNAVGNPLPNQSMKLRLSIHDSSPSGTVVYSETRPIKTNLVGLFSVQIGSAGTTSITGAIAGVNWLVGDKYLQVELDAASNNNFLDIGTVQLVSVPYAFAAGNAATVKSNANLTGVVTSVGNATSIANGAITSDMIGTLNKSKVGLDLVNNTSDASKPISTLTQAALDLKANSTDVNNLSTALGNKLNKADSTLGYVTPTQLAAKTFDQTPITNAIAGKLAIADSTNGYVTPTQLAAKTFDTTSLSSRINSKASAASLATVTSNVASNTSSITANTASISSNTTALALKANIASPTFTGTVTTGIINTGVLSSTSITAPTYASVPKILSYTGTTINWDPAQGLNAAITLSQNSSLSFTAAPPVGSYGTVVLTQDGTGSRTITLPTIASVTNKVLGSTSTSTVALSTAANSKDILNFYYDGTNCYWNIGQGYGDAASASSSTANLATGVTGTLPIANGGTGATTAAAALTNLGAAPVASPTFTGTVTAPIYATTPQALTAGATITWNPAQGLNASVTLDQNSTLSFSSTPPAGAYGTLVVSQDGIGNRTITLPTTANKVLGSTSTTTIALSTASNAKDILNFYYDGTNCFWNIGQGYGTAASSSTTTNITLTTTGTGAATLSGTTLNIPIPSTISIGAIGSSNVNGANITSGVISLAPADGTNGGIVTTGAQTLAGIKSFSSSIAVGTAGAPVSSAALEVSSTVKGFLPPRMTSAQKIAITNPAKGLMIYCTNCGVNGEIEYYNGTSWLNMAGTAAAAGLLEIGSAYQGGILAYYLVLGDPGYDATTPHGLIAATTDQGYIEWYNGGYINTGIRGTAIGTGLSNTNAIILAQGTTVSYAARLAKDYTGGSYTDWYLPSKNELNKILANIGPGAASPNTNIGVFNGVYWSSSELDKGHAFMQHGDLPGYSDTSEKQSVRAVRSF